MENLLLVLQKMLSEQNTTEEKISLIKELVENEKNYNELVKAEQQLTGYFAAKRGYTLTELLQSMGLKPDEWHEMKEARLVEWMDNRQKHDVAQALRTKPNRKNTRKENT